MDRRLCVELVWPGDGWGLVGWPGGGGGVHRLGDRVGVVERGQGNGWVGSFGHGCVDGLDRQIGTALQCRARFLIPRCGASGAGFHLVEEFACPLLDGAFPSVAFPVVAGGAVREAVVRV